jgi:uncharacterized membrane protein
VARWCSRRAGWRRAADRGAGDGSGQKDEAQGTWQASHFSWRIRSVIWAGVLVPDHLAAVPAAHLPGWIAWGLISIWFLYRIVRGMVAMNKSLPVGQ